ncbi:pseudouridine synthase [Leptospira bandrabouensis]|uniref:Pseudouridine synthase n=1 Tax=Leptospira bandrabouensis TaxID=2484903 RepID=A0A6H3P2H6_9LEPT|nr:pseudouridine synthase [Leptospira bandrabouensis]MCG6153151.1 rRNA pseudouridine synthase [Leptospira bandrabouensis]TGN06256.1 rRNA pseudouridine synthase [Leptospira bandrabouensis]TGN16590.1 rRNA pseudouridine synthase [Leptospira bandrabouensis]
MTKERLDKVLGNYGLGSRSDVKKEIHQGHVKVNGSVIKDPGFKVSLSDEVVYYEEALIRKEFYYFMMNKAPDCITATEDIREKTVMDYLSERHRNMNLFPVGRLDKETEGLLLFTTDGTLAHYYTSPKHFVEKEYYAEISAPVSDEDIHAFENGIVLDDGYKTLPARLAIPDPSEPHRVTVWLKEGKYRQIRRMFQSLGKEVVYLKRMKMGNLELDPTLVLGEYRELTSEEESLLKQKIPIIQ